MKTHIKLILAILVAMTFTPFNTHAGIRLEAKKHSFEFFNEGEKPPMDPVMILTFEDLPPEKAGLVEVWKKEITEKIHQTGAVTTDADYLKIYQVIEKYHPQFKANGLSILLIKFPRTLTGGFIYLGRK